jgi:hypothetical protein
MHVYAPIVYRLKVVSSLPPFREDALMQDIGLPSKYFPSDHVALVADVQIL